LQPLGTVVIRSNLPLYSLRPSQKKSLTTESVQKAFSMFINAETVDISYNHISESSPLLAFGHLLILAVHSAPASGVAADQHNGAKFIL
jgi:hypothetical protein